MAFSQKHQGLFLTPWFNVDEWGYVFKLMYSDNNENREEAKNIINQWKIRTPILPAGVEGSLILLNALLMNSDDTEKLHNAYAIALMRFLNVCVANGKQGTFNSSAIKLDVPKWIVTLRHQISHGKTFPTMSALGEALNYCYHWLKVNYWEAQQCSLKDYTPNVPEKVKIETSLRDYVKLYSKLVIHIYKKESMDGEYDPHLWKNINRVIPRKYNKYKSNLKHILLILERYIKDSLTHPEFGNTGSLIADVLIEDLLNAELTGADEFKKIWTNLLNIMNNENGLMPLLEKLHCIACDVLSCKNDRKTASLWLKEIFKGLHLRQLLTRAATKIQPTNEKDSQRITRAVFEKNRELLGAISFKKCCIPETELNCFLDRVVGCPNKLTNVYIDSLMKLNGCTTEHIENTKQLIKSVSENAFNEIIFNNEDVLFDLNNVTKLFPEILVNMEGFYRDDYLSIPENINSDSSTNINENKSTEGESSKWKIVTNTEEYAGLPIGVLPNQSRDKNPCIKFSNVEV